MAGKLNPIPNKGTFFGARNLILQNKSESHKMNILLKQAQLAIEAAVTKASDMKVKMNIAVVDSGANLVAYVRMDGAWLGSLDISIKKAQTAVYFQMPSAEIGKLSQPGGSLYGIEVTNGGIVSFGGGFPIVNDQQQMIGAIGVSGASVKDDEKVAKAGRDAVGGKG